MSSDRLRRIIILILAASSACAVAAQAQTGDLFVDLDDLNLRKTTAHYALAGTVSDAKLDEFSRCLEYIYAEYAKGFAELIRGEDKGRRRAKRSDTPDPFRVVILATRDEYQAFVRPYFGETAEFSAGLYVHVAKLLVISAHGSMDDTYDTLFHESFHQFLHRYVPFAPIWIHEGLATHYGTAQATRRGLVFKQPERRFYRIVTMVSEAKDLIPLNELMTQSSQEFQSGKLHAGGTIDHRTLSYAQSYTLCMYMLNDDAGREHLQNYLRALALAKSPAQATRVTNEHFPKQTLNAMVPGWLALAKR